MAHKYRVELSRRGYGGKLSYAFFADRIEWRGGDSLYVEAGNAKWRIINVNRCINVTTGKDFPLHAVLAVKPATTRVPATNISNAERRALLSLLWCHVSTGIARENGLTDLTRRLAKEFQADTDKHDCIEPLTCGGEPIGRSLY